MTTGGPSEKPALCEFITVPNELLAKVGPGGGPPDAQALWRAEQAIERLARDYGPRCSKDIATLSDAFEAVPDEAMVVRERLRTIHDIAHELRGEAGIYGYTLIGQIAALLCRYLGALDDTAKADIRVVGAHVDALQLVDAEGLEGIGGAGEKQLIDGLTRLQQKVLDR